MGNRISELRKAKGITQRDLAIAFEVTESTVSHWETRDTVTEWIKRVIKLCEKLNCEPEDLLDQEEKYADKE